MRALRSAGRVLDLDVPAAVGSDAKAAVGAVRGVAVAGEPGDEGRLRGQPSETRRTARGRAFEKYAPSPCGSTRA